MNTTLIIDPELQALIPPLADDELAGLKASVLDEGIRDALVVWDSPDGVVLVDGHHRYQIATDYNLPFATVTKRFADKSHAARWMVDNQTKRRNLTVAQRIQMAENFRHVIEAQAQANLSIGGKLYDGTGKPKEGLQNSVNLLTPTNTQKELAKIANTSHDTYHKGTKVLSEAPKTVKTQWQQGDVSTDRAYQLTKWLNRLPEADRDKCAALCGDNVDKAEKLVNLYQSSDSDTSNGTYDEIVRTGGFHYGKDLEDWLAFVDAPITAINKALVTIAEHHKREHLNDQQLLKEQQRAEQAMAITQATDYRHGDCLTILPTLQPKSVKLILTDPPYGIGFQSNRRVASIQAKPILNDDSLDTSLDLLDAMLKQIDKAMANDCRLLVFTSQRYHHEFMTIIQQNGYKTGRTLTWVKENHTSGDLNDFAPQTEWIINAWRGEYTLNHRISEVLQYPRNSQTSHPTEKPVDLLCELIRVTTIPNELIVDPFAGTGATVVAARRMKRQALGIEIDGDYYNEGVIRLND